MRLERQYRGQRSLASGDGAQALQQGAVAKMNAIEIADGQGRGLGCRTGKTAKDEHCEQGIVENGKNMDYNDISG
jgi:hypothetical protein